VIVIVSKDPRERAAFGSLCESHGWPWTEGDSLRVFKRLLRPTRPTVVLTRHRLDDGYSDDLIAALNAAGLLATTKVLVLLVAGSPASLEARQIALGADLVLRDPVRTEVLLEYLKKFVASAKRQRRVPRGPLPGAFRFASARVDPVDRKLTRGKRAHHLTPREVELAEQLAHSPGQVVTYEMLFNEILGRRFRGDTSNLRVLLGKLASTAQQVGCDLRRWVEVIPKLGYRYHPRGQLTKRHSPRNIRVRAPQQNR
jgi:DNA-binding response OmpR family regulator